MVETQTEECAIYCVNEFAIIKKKGLLPITFLVLVVFEIITWLCFLVMLVVGLVCCLIYNLSVLDNIICMAIS